MSIIETTNETTTEVAPESLSHSGLCEIVRALRTERDGLKRTQEAQEARINSLQQTRSEMSADFEIVADRLLQEAIDRDWCGEYDTIVDELNGRLRHSELHRRTTTYNVSFTVELRNADVVRDLESAIDRALESSDEVECSNFNYEEPY